MAARFSVLHTDSTLLPRKIPGISFCYRLSQPQDHNAVARITQIEKIQWPNWNQTRHLSAFGIVPEPTTLPNTPFPGNPTVTI
jgi:hypothetical protein